MTSRQAVRVLLLDEADRVLLVRFRDGDRSWRCTPGGGIEPGETEEADALRGGLMSRSASRPPGVRTTLAHDATIPEADMSLPL